jgi:hypothetical protein
MSGGGPSGVMWGESPQPTSADGTAKTSQGMRRMASPPKQSERHVDTVTIRGVVSQACRDGRPDLDANVQTSDT